MKILLALKAAVPLLNPDVPIVFGDDRAANSERQFTERRRNEEQASHSNNQEH